MTPDPPPCAECGAPLAPDQRYCLSCGARRPDARLPFVDVLAGAETQLVPFGAAGVVPLTSPEHAFEARLRRGLPLLTLLVVLLLAMIIGLLLGHWSGDDGARAAAPTPLPPQVITVSAGAPVAAAPAATTPTETTEAAASDSTPEKAEKSASATKPKAAAGEVKELRGLSGKDYQKKVDALPKSFSTGGKAPPKDDKPAGGGSAAEEIG